MRYAPLIIYKISCKMKITLLKVSFLMSWPILLVWIIEFHIVFIVYATYCRRCGWAFNISCFVYFQMCKNWYIRERCIQIDALLYRTLAGQKKIFAKYRFLQRLAIHTRCDLCFDSFFILGRCWIVGHRQFVLLYTRDYLSVINIEICVKIIVITGM